MTPLITLFYKLTQKEVIPPPIRDVERKNRWIKEIQKTVEADYKPIYIKVVYEIEDPEVVRQRRFFHIAVKYYAIQNSDMFENLPSAKILKDYREQILDDLLGYSLPMVTRTTRRRRSTREFNTVQKWDEFLKTLEETSFASAGYEFPNSKVFWDLVKAHGYEEAEIISIKRLQENIKKKLQ